MLPCVSESASSILSLTEVLSTVQPDAFDICRDTFSKEEVKEALVKLTPVNGSHTADEYTSAFSIVVESILENFDDLEHKVIMGMIATGIFPSIMKDFEKDYLQYTILGRTTTH